MYDVGRLDGQAREVRAAASLIRGGRGRVHLVGIGGVGMAGVALHLQGRGLRVDGCDAAAGSITRWLEQRGIAVAIGHAAGHVAADVDWLVHTAAVGPAHPELAAAAARGLPVFTRGVVLPALIEDRLSIAVAGTHGKTTTTTLIAHLLRAAGRRPGFCIGAEAPGLGGVADTGDGDCLVVEADESDGTAALYHPDLAVITNIELDHVDFFPTRDLLMDCMERLAGQTRRVAALGIDDPGARELAGRTARARTFGQAADAQVRASAVLPRSGGIDFELQVDGQPAGLMQLPVPGVHNVLNALAAITVCRELGISIETLRAGLRSFVPARRRFEIVAQLGDTWVISDYAHHPSEIRALMQQAVGLGRRRLLAVFQPHRYTRTRLLGPDFPAAFDGVARLVIAPVYAASEPPLPGGTAEDLLAHCRARGRYPAECAASLPEAWQRIRADLQPGDVLLVVGAGDVDKIAAWAKDELINRGGGI